MEISPDTLVFWKLGPFVITGTLVYTWAVMLLLAGGSFLVTRKLSTATTPSRWQSGLEMIVVFTQDQIRDIIHEEPHRYLPFLGTLLLFISLSNLLSFVPGFQPPTGSIYTTAALAACVFLAVPVFGILKQGAGGYFRHYISPTPVMLPFTIIGEFSRTLALAVRLFGNVMSGTMIAAILITVVPFFLPVVMRLLDLLVGQIQAYIFTVLAAVYIASATRTRQQKDTAQQNDPEDPEQEPDNNAG